MTEKLFTGTLNHNQNKTNKNIKFAPLLCSFEGLVDAIVIVSVALKVFTYSLRLLSSSRSFVVINR